MSALPQIRAGTGQVPMTEAEFALLRDLIYRHSGIHLPDGKAPMVAGRLSKRVRALGMASFEAYYVHLMDGRDPGELVHMLDCITTNETHFFREPRQFRYLEEEVFPSLKREAEAGRRIRRIRAWSAACSTGEEAYSISMALLWHFPAEDGWKVEVLATDLSMQALRRAQDGLWSVDQARHIPEPYLKRFMRRGTGSQEGWMRAVPEVGATIRLGRLNLHQDRYPDLGTFEIVFCRNVLIYFDEQARTAVLERISHHVEPGGHLLLGHADFPGNALDGLECVRPTIYRRPRRKGRSGV